MQNRKDKACIIVLHACDLWLCFVSLEDTPNSIQGVLWLCAQGSFLLYLGEAMKGAGVRTLIDHVPRTCLSLSRQPQIPEFKLCLFLSSIFLLCQNYFFQVCFKKLFLSVGFISTVYKRIFYL